jgi:hypothetical protein
MTSLPTRLNYSAITRSGVIGAARPAFPTRAGSEVAARHGTGAIPRSRTRLCAALRDRRGSGLSSHLDERQAYGVDLAESAVKGGVIGERPGEARFTIRDLSESNCGNPACENAPASSDCSRLADRGQIITRMV